VTPRRRIAVLEHDSAGAGEQLAVALAAAGAEVEQVLPIRVPDLPLRLRKIGDAPGAVPGTLLALVRGGFDVAHAFTAQDAAVALTWSRLSGGMAVYTQRETLTRANVAHRRLRLATLQAAVERSHSVVAPDAGVAASLRRWMAVDPLVIGASDAVAHLDLYAQLHR
jgi:hypothetical protein